MIESRILGARWIVGIDGGGSGTRVVVADAEGKVLATGTGAGSALSLGIAAAWRRIDETAARAFQSIDEALDWSRCAVAIGIAGAHHKKWARQFTRRAPVCAKLAIETDAFITLLGAHDGCPGSVVVLGTGSVGESITVDGVRYGVGGYGFPAGDEASGAWLGQQASRLVQKALDGRAPRDAVADALLDAIGVSNRTDLIGWFVKATPADYASLTPVVFAHQTSPFIRSMLASAGTEIGEMLDALNPHDIGPAALCGGLGRMLEPFVPPRWRSKLVSPRADATRGALLLAIRSLHAIGAVSGSP